MTTKLLQPSAENIPEITSVSIRTLRDSNSIDATLAVTHIDCSISDYIRVNLLTDTMLSFSNAVKEGQQVTIALFQADSIPHVVTYDTMVRLGTDIFSFPDLSGTINMLDRIVFIYDSFSGSYDLVGYSRGY